MGWGQMAAAVALRPVPPAGPPAAAPRRQLRKPADARTRCGSASNGPACGSVGRTPSSSSCQKDAPGASPLHMRAGDVTSPRPQLTPRRLMPVRQEPADTLPEASCGTSASSTARGGSRCSTAATSTGSPRASREVDAFGSRPSSVGSNTAALSVPRAPTTPRQGTRPSTRTLHLGRGSPGDARQTSALTADEVLRYQSPSQSACAVSPAAASTPGSNAAPAQPPNREEVEPSKLLSRRKQSSRGGRSYFQWSFRAKRATGTQQKYEVSDDEE